MVLVLSSTHAQALPGGPVVLPASDEVLETFGIAEWLTKDSPDGQGYVVFGLDLDGQVLISSCFEATSDGRFFSFSLENSSGLSEIDFLLSMMEKALRDSIFFEQLLATESASTPMELMEKWLCTLKEYSATSRNKAVSQILAYNRCRDVHSFTYCSNGTMHCSQQ